MRVINEMPDKGEFVEIVETSLQIVCHHLKWKDKKLFYRKNDFSWEETVSEPVSINAKYIVKD
jgi:hypothetical protein